MTTAPFRCACGAQWTGMNVCHCAGCHRTFTGIRAFDRHQRVVDPPASCCLDPALIRRRDGTPALQPNSKGWWGEPATDSPGNPHSRVGVTPQGRR